jgi:hypothetical protein
MISDGKEVDYTVDNRRAFGDIKSADATTQGIGQDRKNMYAWYELEHGGNTTLL